MLPHPIEFLANQQLQARLEAAEQHRLLKKIKNQNVNRDTKIRQIRCWLGAQLVEWGYQLQGRRMTTLPQLPECEPCSG